MNDLKFRFVLLTIAVVFVSKVCLAQSEDDEPSIKLKTEKLGKWTVETYEKGNYTYEVYKCKEKNGDYYDGTGPSYHKKFSDGTIVMSFDCIKNNNKDYFKGIYKNGKYSLIIFSNGNMMLTPLQDGRYLFEEDDYNCEKLLVKCGFFGRIGEDYYYILASNPSVAYPIQKTAPFEDYYQIPKVIIGNKKYEINIENGNLYLTSIKVPVINSLNNVVDSTYIFANSQDSIVCCEQIDREEYELKYYEKDSYKGFKVLKCNYVNGDEVYIISNREDDYIGGGTHIHRGNKLFEVKKYNTFYLSLEDGRKFKGDGYKAFKEYKDFLHYVGLESSSCRRSRLLSFESLTPYTGTIINTDNTGVKIVEGLNEDDKAAKDEAERNKRNAEIEKIERDAYNLLCKKFGKRYVDAGLKGEIPIGMPEELFKAFFKPTLKEQARSVKKYYVHGWGTYGNSKSTTVTNKKLKKIVWVTNGKVSNVRMIE